ncbi:MAG: zf-TFIIB domain-containing protein [Candidatus Sumerlaeaceae bacterium]|nr:zf-TFIIB domain-containing protein [Candidatus Sumerlaeaceae bacterium]
MGWFKKKKSDFADAYIPVCPACDKPLVTLEWDNIEIDYCVNCRGTWFDRGEVERIVRGEATEGDPIIPPVKQMRPGKRDKRLCPRCDRKLVEFVACQINGNELRLDACPQNHGIWFDGGELEAYLKAQFVGTAAMTRIASFLKEVFGIQDVEV